MAKDLITTGNNGFDEVLQIIENAKVKVYQAVNSELIDLYWNIGEHISNNIKGATWGNSEVKKLAEHIKMVQPNASGFSWQNLYRMKQFYETYKDKERFSPLVRKIGWSQNLFIMSCKTEEEREFYLTLAIKNRYSKRELERQIDSALYQRTMLSKNFNPKELLIGDKYNNLLSLRDSYVLEFLDLPKNYKEKDLRKAIVGNLKDFILEFGKDFSFIGEEYRVQVGDSDFYIDLLFHNRELNCLVAIELKTTKFIPEYIGKMQFYLEALDRGVRKETEGLSIGLLLCASKDDSVVEYTMAKSSTPSQIATYELVLPNKELLQQKLEEIKQLTQESE